MSSDVGLLRPGIVGGSYPEREHAPLGRLDRAVVALSRWRGGVRPSGDALGRFALETRRLSAPLREQSSAMLAEHTRKLAAEMARVGPSAALMPRAFALTMETVRRELGFELRDVQLMGGWVMARGMLAEMATGEGKTVTATLPAAAVALAGTPVHVVSVNDYLVERDATAMRPVYEALGLSVGFATEAMKDPAARHAAYACDVCYVTAKQLGFDYLRDRLTRAGASGLQAKVAEFSSSGLRKKLLLRGLCFAIVDEADSVLIDEARTPLILAGSGANDTENAHLYRDALGFASGLERGRDFELDQRGGVALTPRGVDRLEARATGCDGIWSGPRRRAEWVTRALVALHVFETDRHYLVRDGRVEIIDASTGRSASDRSWSEGLHQLIQVKECCPVTAPAEPLARVSYQHLFRRYLRLAGMTGTAREVSRELRATYRLDTVPIPRHEPCRVRVQPSRIFASDEERWRAVVARTAELHASGRPVLVGTCSVASSESLSQQLDAAGVPHDVLNARDDVNEANTVARAGEPGRVTVSTRMAGRGTDIPLADGVSELGGLHVIATEKAEARRIDRQLRGRCGRQGDPGSYEELHSLDGGPLSRLVAPMLRRICTSLLRLSFHRTVLALTYLAQRAEEMGYAQERRVLEWQEEKLEELLSFSGSRR